MKGQFDTPLGDCNCNKNNNLDSCQSSLSVVIPPHIGEKVRLRIVNVKDIKSASRLLSRLIKNFQQGKIDDKSAKTLAYLCQVMVQLIHEHEFENRIKNLEERVIE